jgi:hypothetical protein
VSFSRAGAAAEPDPLNPTGGLAMEIVPMLLGLLMQVGVCKPVASVPTVSGAVVTTIVCVVRTQTPGEES